MGGTIPNTVSVKKDDRQQTNVLKDKLSEANKGTFQ
jgi:hypothetical protein